MDPAVASMIDNLPKNTGRSLEEWYVVLDASGLEKHTELMTHLKSEHGVSHGYANGIVLQYRSRGVSSSDDDLVDAQYSGSKAGLRPLYDVLVAAVHGLGPEVEVSPKRASVSLRRAKQFALIEAASATRLRVGINLKGIPPNDRLKAATGMCTHQVSVTGVEDVDEELMGWLKQAYDLA